MFRKILFWTHLVAGLISGISVGIMCFTGTALTFEKQMIAWADRDARRVEPPAKDAPRLTIEQLQAKLREAQPEARPTNVVIQNDAHAAIGFTAGGRGGAGNFYLDPYTGAVRQSQQTKMQGFMATMTSWHRYLGFTGETSRPNGKLINGICNLAFCMLAITGLYLWMPRKWSMRSVKALAIFNWRLTGKARDFNWHNSIGLWSAPILIVLTLTAVPISFQWGGRVINTLTGTPQPVPGQPAAAPAAQLPPIVIAPPPAGTAVLSQEALVAAVKQAQPTWETITIGAAAGRGGAGAGAAAGGRGGRGGREGGRGGRGEGRGGRGEGAPAVAQAPAPAAAPTGTPGVAAPATFTVRLADAYPRTAAVTLTLNPYTGEVLRRTGYADQAPAQKVRSWTRFLHTGEALGFWGQLVAGLACLGGCFLVYTGFALSYRRFFGKRAKPPAPTAVAANS